MTCAWVFELALLGMLEACQALPRARAATDDSWEARADELGPGFDIVWLGSEEDLDYVHLYEDHVLWVDGQHNALMGPRFDQLTPAGFQVKGSPIGSELGTVYSLTKDGGFYRQSASKPAQLLWKAPWEIDQLRGDAEAFYAVIVDCRKCLPKHREQVWSIPKHEGKPQLLYSAYGEIIRSTRTDGEALYVNLFRWSDEKSMGLRIATRGNSISEPEVVDEIPQGGDAHFQYDYDRNGTYRIARADGSRTKLGPVPIGPIAIDSVDLIYERDQNLYALAKTGGQVRRIANWAANDSPPYCKFCGSSRDAACVHCGTVVYQVPKQVRPRGKMFERDAGTALAITENSLFWTDYNSIQRLPRSDPFSGQSATAFLKLPGVGGMSSPLLPDQGHLYGLLVNGGVLQVSQASAEARWLQEGDPSRIGNGAKQPLQHCLATDEFAVYFIDVVQGAIVRRDNVNDRRVVVPDVAFPLAIALRGESLFLLAASDSSDTARPQRPIALFEFDKNNGTLKRRVEFPESNPVDMAATDKYVYVSFSGGALFRLDEQGAQAQRVFPLARIKGLGQDHTMPSLKAGRLGATEHALFFAAEGQLLTLRDGAQYPTVLVSDVDGHSEYLVADSHALFFGLGHRFKWEKWIELGMVPLQN